MGLQGKYRKLSIINGYAPKEDKDLNLKTKFFEDMNAQIEKILKFDMKIVMGDMNSKIRREEQHKHVAGGKSLLPKTNQYLKCSIDFAELNNMVIKTQVLITNIFIKQHGRHLIKRLKTELTIYLSKKYIGEP